jgi:hypothetical protein
MMRIAMPGGSELGKSNRGGDERRDGLTAVDPGAMKVPGAPFVKGEYQKALDHLNLWREKNRGKKGILGISHVAGRGEQGGRV